MINGLKRSNLHGNGDPKSQLSYKEWGNVKYSVI